MAQLLQEGGGALRHQPVVIHHEDALRGDGAVGPRREVPERTARAVHASLRSSAKLMFRRSPVGVRLVAPGREAIVAGPDSPVVTVSGDPVELLLALVTARRLDITEVSLAQVTDDFVAHLAARRVGSEIYYPIPLHLQACFAPLGHKPGDFPESERAAAETLALPMYPELTEVAQAHVVGAVAEFLATREATARGATRAA